MRLSLCHAQCGLPLYNYMLPLQVSPLTGKPFSPEYFSLIERQKKLNLKMNDPAVIAQLQKTMKEHQVILLKCQTGTGKSVWGTQHVLRILNYNGMVVCTQPKQLSAQDISRWVATLMDVEWGREVGFKHGGETKYIPGVTKLLFATEGSIVQTALTDPYMSQYSAVIVDEVHERNVDTDLLLYLLRNLVLSKRRPDLKIVLISATIDPVKFGKYFAAAKGGMGQMAVESGTTFPVARHFLPEMPKDVFETGAQVAGDLLASSQTGDILFFVPGKKQADTVEKALLARASAIECKFIILTLKKGLTKEEEERVTQTSAAELGVDRKVVLATDLAEASVTVSGITIVMDCGVKNTAGYDPVTDSKTLDLAPISKSSIIQRIGRTGRVAPGDAYLLYTEEWFNALQQDKTPTIFTQDPTPTAMSLMASELPSKFRYSYNALKKSVLYQLIDPFSAKWAAIAEKSMIETQLMNKTSKRLTKIGKYVAPLGLSPRLGLAVLAAIHFRCVDVILLISAQTVWTPAPPVPSALLKKFVKICPNAHNCLLWQNCLMLEDYLKNKDSEKIWCETYEIDINIMEAAAMQYTSSLQAYIKSANRLQGLLHFRKNEIPADRFAAATKLLITCFPRNLATRTGKLFTNNKTGVTMACGDRKLAEDETVVHVLHLSTDRMFGRLMMGQVIPLRQNLLSS